MSDQLTALLDQHVETIKSAIDTQVKESVEKHARPAGPRVPWATSGPVPERGYSFLRAAAYAKGLIAAGDAKEEVHAHEELKALYQGRGFVPTEGERSFLFPFATAHIPDTEPKGHALKYELRAKLTADADRYDPDEAAWIRRKALGTVSDLAGGTLVPFPALGELIELQRNLEVFASAGAQEVALPPQGRVQFPKVTGGSTAYWVGEAAAITDSTPATGQLSLEAKKLGVRVTVNNELLRFASPSADGLIRSDMARVAALKADLAMLEGTGGTQIKGLITYPDINGYSATTAGADGDTFEPEDVLGMEARLPDAVPTPSAWVMRKRMFAAIANRRADAVTAADGKGGFLFNLRRFNGGVELELNGTKVVRSGQVSNTRTKGDGIDLTYVLCGWFPDWVTARMGVGEFAMNPYADVPWGNDQTYLRMIQHVDAGPRHAASFVVCDSLIEA